MFLGVEGQKPTIWSYSEGTGTLNVRAGGDASSLGWHLLQLSVGFCVFDVLLVFVETDQVAKVFGVQITISKNPFVAHDTHDTCKQGSKKRIDTLTTALQESFKTREIVYVMLAPKAKEGTFAAPGHTAPYYFAPPDKVGAGFASKAARKRKAEKCCKCSKGRCTTNNCSCHKAGKQCINCASSSCATKESAKKGKK